MPGDVVLRVADPERRLRGVRLVQDLGVPGDRLAFERVAANGTAPVWELAVDLRGAQRMEYLLELHHEDGGTETVPDAGNPHRVPGAFGEKSEVTADGYREPPWLRMPAPPGETTELAVTARALRHPVDVRLWSPAGLDPGAQVPLLVANDGPEYDALSGLTTYLAAAVEAGWLPPVRAALLAPGDRDAEYSANGHYSRALALAVLPRLRRELPTRSVVGMGASLGALAMFAAHRRFPESLDALFLQSGSFFHPSYDVHERGFRWYDRIAQLVDAVARAGGTTRPVPTVLTCGVVEENLTNNEKLTRVLAAQGYDVALHVVPDGHNYVGWRDAFHPHLTRLLRLAASLRSEPVRSVVP